MTELDELQQQVRARRRELDGLSGEARSVLMRGKELTQEIGELVDEQAILDRVTGLLNSLGEQRQLAAQNKIEELVTRGLQTIFDDSLSFHIVQTTKAKAASIEFLVRSTAPGLVVDTPVMDARGGGLATVIGFLLRLVVMLLRGGNRQENILILDETFAMVSAEYLEPLGQFLREVVDKTGVQIVMVTHQPEFEEFADVVHRFSQIEGKTVVESA